MAQQLSLLRTPEAYAGVSAYAHKHTGEAAAAAYLALGHAYLLDKRYAEAESRLRQSKQSGDDLADYADFLARRRAMMPAIMPRPRLCCMVLSIAIRTAFSMCKRRNSKRMSCWL